MEIKLTLALPRDELSVPVARRVLKQSMEAVGVSEDVTSDVMLALTEACTNVLDHAGEGNEYEVSAGIDGDTCVIEVIDRGVGFHGDELGRGEADTGAEDGRGIQLMRALVDKVQFQCRPQVGTVVHLEKQLTWHDDAPIKTLTEDNAAMEHGPWSRDGRREDTPEPV